MEVRGDALVGEEREASVIVRVMADEVVAGPDPSRRVGLGLDPATLQEQGGRHVGQVERVQEPIGVARPMGPVRVLQIEGHRDAPGRHLSTPEMTIPRVKNRWVSRKAMTGITSVISVPAWMMPGSLKCRPLSRDRPTAIGCRSGSVDR